MELRQAVTSDGTVTLTCSCGSEAFRILFKKSKSAQIYESYGAEHHPDTQVAECTSCGSEITITSSEPQMQASQYWQQSSFSDGDNYVFFRPEGDEVIDDMPNGYQPKTQRIWTDDYGVHIQLRRDK
jgi:hypothetical protein